MQDAEFEERDFEGALYLQLASKSKKLWTPGQVFEHYIGFDAALETHRAFFLNSLGKPYFSRNLTLKHLNFGYVWRPYGKKHGLPSFKTNALIQAKRPQYLIGPNRKIASKGIPGSYWRFETVPHQQRLLDRLTRKVGRRAVVSYACPAFHLWDDLDRHIYQNELVEHCSYVTAQAMTSHDYWCFNQPGGVGVGCSEPERIEEDDFLEMVSSVDELQGAPERSPTAAKENLGQFALAVRESVNEESEAANGLALAVKRLIERIRAENDLPPEWNAYLDVSLFAHMLGFEWFVIGSADAVPG